MDAHSLALQGCDERIDVPLRVFFSGYYPNLTALYERLAVKTEQVDYSASFGPLNGGLSFRYRNRVVGGFSLPYVGPRELGRPRLLYDILRFFATARRRHPEALATNTTLVEYLHQKRYSTTFVQEFLLPALAGIGTCSYQAVEQYPAHVVLGYYANSLFFRGVQRVVGGAELAVAALASTSQEQHLGVSVDRVEHDAAGVRVGFGSGESEVFDHVVVATQANQARRFLGDDFAAEKDLLGRFPYERSQVVVHTDTSLAPSRRRDWSPVNFLWKRGDDRPMATIWMNAVQSALRSQPPTFQTWNPIAPPAEDTIIGRAEFERPTVSADTVSAVRDLDALHDEQGRRVWFVGSYCQLGIPLLESAVTSSVAVAAHLDCRAPWMA